MELRFNGLVLPIAQMGHNFLILKDSIDHPPTDAEITLSIDGNESRWTVNLPVGLSTTQQRTSIAPSHFNGSTVR